MINNPIAFKGKITLKNYSLCCKNGNRIQDEISSTSKETIETKDIIDIKYNEAKCYTSISTLKDGETEVKEYRVPKSCAPLSTILAAYHYAQKDPCIRIIL